MKRLFHFVFLFLLCGVLHAQGIGGKAKTGGASTTGGGVTTTTTGTFTFVQQGTCTPTTNTCTLAGFTQNPAAGDLYIIGLANRATGAYVFVSNTQFGPVTPVGGCGGAPGAGGIYYLGSCYYILPPASTGYTTSTPTVTLSGTGIGTTSYILVQEWQPSANGSHVALDNDGSLVQTTASATGPAFTASGVNDVTFAMEWSGTSNPTMNSVAAPYATHLYPAGGTTGAALTGAISTATPTFTLSGSGTVETGAVSFGWNPSACADQMLDQFSGAGTGNGTTATVALLTASQVGGFQGGVWTQSNSTGTMPWTFTTAGAMPLLNSTGRLCNGSSYPAGTPSFGLTMSGLTSSTGINVWEFNFLAVPSTTVIATTWWSSTMLATDASNVDCFGIHGQADFAAVNCYSVGGTHRIFQMETPEGNCGSSYTMTPSSVYALQIQYQVGNGVTAGTHVLTVFNSAGVQVFTCSHAGAVNPDYAQYMFLGDVQNGSMTTGTVMNFSNMQLSLDGSVPNK